MPNLFELTTEFNFFRHYFDGDVTTEEGEQMLEKLNELSNDIKSKTLNIGLISKEMELEIEKFKKAELEIKKRRQIIESKVERLKDYLQAGMKSSGINKISNQYIQISLKINPPSVEVYDEGIIPSNFYKSKTVSILDKLKVKESMKKGLNVPGCLLKRKNRVEIK